MPTKDKKEKVKPIVVRSDPLATLFKAYQVYSGPLAAAGLATSQRPKMFRKKSP
jgi:hypothetical protein